MRAVLTGGLPLKVAIDVRSLTRRPSGVGHYIRNLLRGFAAVPEGARFALCCRDPGALPSDLPRDATILRAPVSSENHPWGDLWRDVLLPRRLRALGIDIFHGPAFMVPRDRRGFACVVTIHDLVAFLHPETVPWRYSLYMRAQIGSAIRRADRIIAISEAERDELAEIAGVARERVRVVYHGVEPRFRPTADPAATRATLARYGIDRPYVLHLGNIEPRKNLAGVFRAHRLLRERLKEPIALVVCGATGWLCRDILAEADRLGGGLRPIFTGYVTDDEVPRLLGAASAFLFPSLYEGFGLPILEAMACGVPVVTSDRGAMREIAGGAARLVDPLDPEAIADAVVRVVSDPGEAQRLVAAGRERAAGFRWERTARETLAVYREAIDAA